MSAQSKNAITLVAAYALSTGASAVFAHDGHGLVGSHWHATDTWGLVAMMGVVAMAVWLSRGKK